MDFFMIGLNSFCLGAQCAMHLFFVCRLTAKKQKVRYFFIYLLILFLFGMPAGAFAPGVNLLGLYGLNRIALGNQRSVSWAAAILSIYISQLSFGIVNSVESVLFPHFIGKPLLYLLVIFATAAALAINFGCYIAVLKCLPLEADGQASDITWLLFPMLFFFTAELYILETAYTAQITYDSRLSLLSSLMESGKQMALLSLQVLGLGALFCTLYAYRKVCRGFQAQAALDSLTQAAQAQKVYIAEAQLRYKQTRAVRHDIKNHLSVLDSLLNSGKYDEGRNWLQKLEAGSASLDFPYQTGNSIVDILLCEKLGLAKANGIREEVNLVLPSPCGIDDFDLCVIFANALDNAVTACQDAQGERGIRILGERQGDFYMLEFENTCRAGPLPPMGTGLANIRTVAEKYHGAMLTEKTGQRFTLNVLLNISSHTPDGDCLSGVTVHGLTGREL